MVVGRSWEGLGLSWRWWQSWGGGGTSAAGVGQQAVEGVVVEEEGVVKREASRSECCKSRLKCMVKCFWGFGV